MYIVPYIQKWYANISNKQSKVVRDGMKGERMRFNEFREKDDKDWTLKDVMHILGGAVARAESITYGHNDRPKKEKAELDSKLLGIADGYGELSCEEMIPMIDKWKTIIKTLEKAPTAAHYFSLALNWLYEHKDVKAESRTYGYFMCGWSCDIFKYDDEATA